MLGFHYSLAGNINNIMELKVFIVIKICIDVVFRVMTPSSLPSINVTD
jgi:hypothetical protein